MTPIELAKSPDKDKNEDEQPAFEPGSLDDPYVGLEAREDLEDLNNIPGSALRAFLDTTHPLAYGMDPRLYSLKFGNEALETIGGVASCWLLPSEGRFCTGFRVCFCEESRKIGRQSLRDGSSNGAGKSGVIT